MNVSITTLVIWFFSFLCTGIAWADDPASQLEALPNVKVNYYELQSLTYRELREEMHQKGPADLQKRPRDAYTHWEIKWKWPFDKDGKARLKETTTEYAITVTLPKWNAPLDAPPEELQKWEKFYAAIVLHERGHVDNVLRNFPRIQESIRSTAKSNSALKTKEANDIGDHILDEMKKFDLDYDHDTQNGATQGVVFR